VAHLFATSGYDVVSFDYQGFGQSPGKRGYVQSHKWLVRQAQYFIYQVCWYYRGQGLPLGKFGDLPIVLGGQGIGASIALRLAQMYPDEYQMLVLLSPGVQHWRDENPMLKRFCKVARFLMPWMPLHELDHSLANRNPSVQEEESQDPYMFNGKLYVATVAALFNLMEECRKNLHLLKTPFVVAQGRIDKVVDPNGAFDLIE
jgi:alpha-beta hydrolase superfamily lysophospholipase